MTQSSAAPHALQRLDVYEGASTVFSTGMSIHHTTVLTGAPCPRGDLSSSRLDRELRNAKRMNDSYYHDVAYGETRLPHRASAKIEGLAGAAINEIERLCHVAALSIFAIGSVFVPLYSCLPSG